MISLAPPGDATPIQVDRGVDPVVTIEVPSVERALHDACGRAARGDSSGIIAGRVLTTWDVPERSEPATISARWTAGGRQILQETRADALGFFRVCGVPRGRGVSLTAVQGRASSGETLVVTSDRWLLTPVQLHLSPPPARSSPLLPAPTAERWGRILPGEFGSRP